MFKYFGWSRNEPTPLAQIYIDGLRVDIPVAQGPAVAGTARTHREIALASLSRVQASTVNPAESQDRFGRWKNSFRFQGPTRPSGAPPASTRASLPSVPEHPRAERRAQQAGPAAPQRREQGAQGAAQGSDWRCACPTLSPKTRLYVCTALGLATGSAIAVGAYVGVKYLKHHVESQTGGDDGQDFGFDVSDMIPGITR